MLSNFLYSIEEFRNLPFYWYKSTLAVMKLNGVLFVLVLKNLFCVDSIMQPMNYVPLDGLDEDESSKQINEDEEGMYQYPYHRVLGLAEGSEHRNEKKNEFEFDNNPMDRKSKSCSVLVLSNSYNPTMQSLLRKYRYDAKGILIPSSVKYYMKLPQTVGSDPILVPLNSNTYSPLGGFVRYYKEVPPIPQLW